MKTIIKKSSTIILKLEEDEALWLKTLMQNPLCISQEPHNEDKISNKMRSLFFNSLPSEQELKG